MAGTLSTFYFDGTSFATATAVYTNATLTTLAPDGYYSNEVLVRQQLNGVLLNATTCTTCAICTICTMCTDCTNCTNCTSWNLYKLYKFTSVQKIRGGE